MWIPKDLNGNVKFCDYHMILTLWQVSTMM
jgi:hypothetical protein